MAYMSCAETAQQTTCSQYSDEQQEECVNTECKLQLYTFQACSWRECGNFLCSQKRKGFF